MTATLLQYPDCSKGVPLNPSGIWPMDLRVLVLPDEADEKKGSLYMPQQVQEKEKYAKVEATIVAVGENAWEEAAGRAHGFVKPVPGDRVLIAKYGGVEVEGRDKRKYRVLNDTDIIARLG